VGLATAPLAASAQTDWKLPPNATGSSIGRAIIRRLSAVPHTEPVFFVTSRDGPQPRASFCVGIDYAREGSLFFSLCVQVYSSHALAESAYGSDYGFVQQQGNPDANQFDVVGPIEFWGTTHGAGYSGYPPSPLPRRAFLKWVGIALGRTA
jgi:hypothetical protein